jgi:hypothetical protein
VRQRPSMPNAGAHPAGYWSTFLSLRYPGCARTLGTVARSMAVICSGAIRGAVAGAAAALDGEGSDWPAMRGAEAGPACPGLQGRQAGSCTQAHAAPRELSLPQHVCVRCDGHEAASINLMCEKAIADGLRRSVALYMVVAAAAAASRNMELMYVLCRANHKQQWRTCSTMSFS